MAHTPSENIRPVDPILTTYANALRQDRAELKADVILESTPTGRTGQVWLKNTRDGMGQTDVDLRRAPGSEFKRIEGNEPSATAFTVGNRGLEQSIPIEDIQDSQSPYDLYQDAVENVIDDVLIDWEVYAASKLFDNTRYTTTDIGTGGTRWDANNSTPLLDLETLRRQFELGANGVQPDTLVLGRDPGYALMQSTQFRDYMGNDRNRMLPIEWAEVQRKLSSVLGIREERIIWAKGLRETAAKGATSSVAAIWGDFVGMYKLTGVSPSTAPEGAGVRVRPVESFTAVRHDLAVRKYEEIKTDSMVVRVDHHRDIVRVRSGLGRPLEDVPGL